MLKPSCKKKITKKQNKFAVLRRTAFGKIVWKNYLYYDFQIINTFGITII